MMSSHERRGIPACSGRLDALTKLVSPKSADDGKPEETGHRPMERVDGIPAVRVRALRPSQLDCVWSAAPVRLFPRLLLPEFPSLGDPARYPRANPDHAAFRSWWGPPKPLQYA